MEHSDSDVAAHSRSDFGESVERFYPLSLLAVAVLVLIVWFVLFGPIGFSPLVRTVVSIPLLLFAPGYAIVAALVPERNTSVDSGRTDGVDTLTRVTFSVVLSLVLVPLLGFALNFTSSGIRLVPAATLIGLVTIAATAVAVYRWWALPPSARFSLGVRRHLALLWDDLFAARSRADYVLNVVLVVAVLVAVGGVVYGAFAASGTGGHSDLFLANETGNGTLAFENYPTNFTIGESRQVTVGLKNREGTRESYTVAVVLERVEDGAVTERTLLDRYDPTLADGEEWLKPTTVTPTMTGDHLRLTYEVYVGGAPADLRSVQPDYTTYLWIDVSPV